MIDVYLYDHNYTGHEYRSTSQCNIITNPKPESLSEARLSLTLQPVMYAHCILAMEFHLRQAN